MVKRPVIFIFNPGKVGSTSLVNAFRRIEYPFVRIHNILVDGEFASRNIMLQQTMQNAAEVRMITLVRDPLMRNISAFFYRLTEYAQYMPRRWNDYLWDERLVTTFIERYPHHRPEEWYQDELQALTGINVFQQPFAPGRGYKFYRQGKFNMLLLRTEQLSIYAPYLINRYFNIQLRVDQEFRTIDRQDTGELYAHFMQHANLPRDFVISYYGRRIAQHFYSAQERQYMQARWINLNE